MFRWALAETVFMGMLDFLRNSHCSRMLKTVNTDRCYRSVQRTDSSFSEILSSNYIKSEPVAYEMFLIENRVFKRQFDMCKQSVPQWVSEPWMNGYRNRRTPNLGAPGNCCALPFEGFGERGDKEINVKKL